MKISVFGNEDLKKDSLPVKLIPQLEEALPQHEFIHQDPNEDVLPPEEKDWLIIDTVQGIKEVELIENLDRLKSNPRFSLHDYDLGMHLQLLKKIYPDLKVRIIGIPMSGDKDKILRKLISLLSNLLSESGWNN